jgi:hypothetical protein
MGRIIPFFSGKHKLALWVAGGLRKQKLVSDGDFP